jgi:hypothetical protein
MALRDLSALDSDVESHPNQTQPNYERRAQILRYTEERGFLANRRITRIQLESFRNDDYQIALVPRKKRARPTGSIQQESTDTDRILLLPLTWRELLDRVCAEVNGSGSVERSRLMRFGEVRVDFSTMEISRSEKPVTLRPQEFKLLGFFTQNPHRVISRNELLNTVWGYNNYPSTRTVDNHIWMLRQKLELNPAHPMHFLTVHGIGYKFVP